MAVVSGTSGDDALAGQNGDFVFGFGGADRLTGNSSYLIGGAGNDTITGYGNGSDESVLDYSSDAAEGGLSGVTVILNRYSGFGSNGTAKDGFGNTDTILGVDNVVGTNQDDIIIGSADVYYDVFYSLAVSNTLQGLGGNDYLSGLDGYDSLFGGDGNDILNGGANPDTLDGGTGFDLATYADSQTGLVANLSDPSQNTGDAAHDAYFSIEGLIGSYGDDTLVSSAGSGNQLWGSSGNDQLYAFGGHAYVNGGNDNDSIYSGGGANTIDGSSGFDMVRYDYAAAGVVAALDPSASPYNTGAAAGDTYSSVEGLTGSAFHDVLFGDAGGNQLYGRDGNDFLVGNGGDDALYGGIGANELLGGTGNDYFDFYASDLQAGVTSTIDDFRSVAGNTDHVYLLGVQQNAVTYTPLQTGTDINIAINGGTATIFAANASLASVQNQTSFF